MRARLLLLAAALAAFGGSLLAGFHLDDYAIFAGPLLKSVREPHLLTQATFWLNYQVGGQDSLGYHIFNLLLHLGAVLLAYECLRRLLPPNAAVIAAAIFAVHPLQAEAVNHVAARSVMLAAILCFAALLAWIEDWPWLSVVAFGLALLADEQCAFFPVVLILLRPQRKWQALSMFLLGLAAFFRADVASSTLLPGARLLQLLILPWGFTVSPQPLSQWISAAVLVAVIGILGWMWRLESRIALWLTAGVAVLLGPVGPNPASDPRAYLALFAFAAGLALLLERIPVKQIGIAIVVILALLSVSRTYVWMSEERLWREAVRRAPDQVEPKIQLAKAVKAAEALELLGRARQLAPHNPEVPAEIGRILLEEKQYDGALDELSHAVALNPKNALAFNNRGVALAALGHPDAAAADFQHALLLDPALTEAQENLQRLGGR